LFTPLLACAAAFVGAWLGAGIGGSIRSPTRAGWVMVGFGAGFGLIAAWGWLRYLRKSPRLQESLAVAPDGTPLAAVADEPAEPAK
jgi:hypothetical protein